MSLGTIVSEPFTTPFDNAYADGISGWWRWDPTPQTELFTVVSVTFDAAWTAGQKNSAGIALNRWAQFSNLTFAEPVGGTQADLEAAAEIVIHLTVGANIGGFGGYSGTPGEALSTTVQNVNGDNVLVGDTGQVHTYIASDGNLNGAACFDAGGNLTAAGFELVMHEVGHAIGLKHPHDHGAIINPVLFPGVTFGDSADLGDNNLNQQLYTVMSYNQVQGFGGGECSTPMAFDIAAVQHMYGARTNMNAGDNTYVLPDPNNATTWSCIWDTGGIDQIVYGGSANAVIDLRPATLDNSPTGGGMPSYTQTGTIFGHGFTISGDFTNAIADQNGVTGVIIENASGGSGNDSLTGNDVANLLTGNGGNDTLVGGGGNDTLNGGLGVDLLMGGAGDDWYFVNTDLDQVREAKGAGYDRVLASASFTLHPDLAEVEELSTTNAAGTLSIALTGSNSNNRIVGNAGSNTLRGRGGNDTLDGGLGSDLLEGGTGNDTYFVDTDFDQVREAAGEGFDRVFATASFTLHATLAEVEVLQTTNNAGVTAINLTGSNFDNRITGNAAANVLNGRDGNDTLKGLAGADTLLGGEDNDRLEGGGGNDLLDGGTGSDTLLGGAGADTLRGNSGADMLVGATGDDVLQGGAGSDLLESGGGADTLQGGGGNDTLLGGNGNDRLVGRGGNDVLDGGNTNDRLDGGAGNDTLTGGAGNDTLIGGADADRFVFAPGHGTARIADFEDTVDLIDLTGFGFASVAQARSFASNVGSDVVFDFAGGEQLIVENITKAQITGADLLI